MKSVGYKKLQLYHLQIIRNKDSTLEVLGSFTGVIFFTISKRFLLRMIQDKILHAQLLLGKNHVDDGPALGCWESGAQNRYYKSGKP